MSVKEYRGIGRVFVRLRSLAEARRLVEYLTNEAVPFEFMPVPADMYEVLVRPEYSVGMANALDSLGIEPETTGKEQETALETVKVYKHEGVDLRLV